MATETPFPTIHDIGSALEVWAPPGSAQSYDNVGLQVGDARREVHRALIALDLTPGVLQEAQRHEATLIITHHPLIFTPLRTITADGFVNSLALRLAEAGIALYSIHTNLDAAPGGVSFALAEHLGLHDIRFLDSVGEALCMVVTSLPSDYAAPASEALAKAGAHRVACRAISTPTVLDRSGQPADNDYSFSTDSVVRLEIHVPRWNLKQVVRALQQVHPDDHIAYDVYPVEQPYTGAGLGAIGRLASPMKLLSFLQRVGERLRAASLRYVGDLTATVETVAVCGGSGSSFTRQALRAGADAYVTADVTYHKFFDVLDPDGHPRMALIDAGHYETEAITERLLQDWLADHFPTVDWLRTESRTSPIDTFIPT